MQAALTRVELRALVDSYASAVDRKEPGEVASLFSTNGRLVTTFGPGTPEKPVVHEGRQAIHSVLAAGLAPYLCTTHIVGAHVVDLSGSHHTGETTCLAHHVYEREGKQRLLVMALRYADSYVLEDERWCFDERRLSLQWRQHLDLGT
jgi:SnoaL-like domain